MARVIALLSKDKRYEHLLDILNCKKNRHQVTPIYLDDPNAEFFCDISNGAFELLQDGCTFDLNADIYLYFPVNYGLHCSGFNFSTSESDSPVFTAEQWAFSSEYIIRNLPSGRFWINDFDKARLYGNKSIALKKAIELGYRVPKTVLSNSVALIAKKFQNDGKFISKVAGPHNAYNDDLLIPSSLFMTSELYDDPASVQFSPAIYQEFVSAELELRTYVIGSNALSIGINRNLQADVPDIRFNRQAYESATITQDYLEYEQSLIELTLNYGLIYCAYDSLISLGDSPLLVDVNPHGEWDYFGIDEVSQFVALELLREINDRY